MFFSYSYDLIAKFNPYANIVRGSLQPTLANINQIKTQAYSNILPKLWLLICELPCSNKSGKNKRYFNILMEKLVYTTSHAWWTDRNISLWNPFCPT